MHSDTVRGGTGLLLAVAFLIVSFLPSVPAQAQPSPALCGPNDHPETGVQGDIPPDDRERWEEEGFNCGAGLRVFDIRHPQAPMEVAYFNHGPLAHAGVSHYDAARGLIYVPGADAFWILELQPQVREHLGLDEAEPWRPGLGRPPWSHP